MVWRGMLGDISGIESSRSISVVIVKVLLCAMLDCVVSWMSSCEKKMAVLLCLSVPVCLFALRPTVRNKNWVRG